MSDDFDRAIKRARAKLRPMARPDRAPMRALLAAGFFAVSAITFATVAVLAPPNETTPANRTGVR